MSDTVSKPAIEILICINGKVYTHKAYPVQTLTQGIIQYECDKMLLEICHDIKKDFPV